MVLWDLLGITFGVGAYLLGWCRWLVAAPYLAAGWVGLVAYAATLPRVNGQWGWIPLGCITINVWALLPLIMALVGAWVSKRARLSARGIIIVSIVLMNGILCVNVFRSETRMNRVRAFVTGQTQPHLINHEMKGEECLSGQCKEALTASKWFGRAEFDLKRLPESMGTCMPVAVSVLFGKWCLVLLCLAFTAMAAGVILTYATQTDERIRAFAAIFGLGMVGVAVRNLLGCLQILPCLNFGIPLASYGGTLAVMAWVGLGIMVSVVRHSAFAYERGTPD